MGNNAPLMSLTYRWSSWTAKRTGPVASRSASTISAWGRPSETRTKSVAKARRSEEHTSELQSLAYLVCRLLLEKKKKKKIEIILSSDRKRVKSSHTDE